MDHDAPTSRDKKKQLHKSTERTTIVLGLYPHSTVSQRHKKIYLQVPKSSLSVIMDGDSTADATSTSVSSSDAGSVGSSNSSLLPPPPPPPPPPPQTATTAPVKNLEQSFGDLEQWLAKLQMGTPLTEPEVKLLTELARERLLQESNVQPVPAPVTICGDIHVRTMVYRRK